MTVEQFATAYPAVVLAIAMLTGRVHFPQRLRSALTVVCLPAIGVATTVLAARSVIAR